MADAHKELRSFLLSFKGHIEQVLTANKNDVICFTIYQRGSLLWICMPLATIHNARGFGVKPDMLPVGSISSLLGKDPVLCIPSFLLIAKIINRIYSFNTDCILIALW